MCPPPSRCGGPVYVSDRPGEHDMDMLRRLVLPDGSVLRAQLPGRPTRDCLFGDPSLDQRMLLKARREGKEKHIVYGCKGPCVRRQGACVAHVTCGHCPWLPSTLLCCPQVWNTNAVVGVVGVFNLQGAKWDRSVRRFRTFDNRVRTLEATVAAHDVETMRPAPARAATAEQQVREGAGLMWC